jgi:hypothetical protein
MIGQETPMQTTPARSRPTVRPPARHAIVLTALLWPACLAGAFLGALIGVITGAAGDRNGGWMALAWGVVGIMIGTAIAAGLLGWIWAHACGRTRWLPAVVLTILLGIGGTSILMLLSRVPGSDQDLPRITGSIVIAVVVTSLTFVIGRRTPQRPAPRKPAAVAALQ